MGGTVSEKEAALTEVPAPNSKEYMGNLSRALGRPLGSALLFALILALIAWRSGDALLLPSLDFEDGRDMLAFYFNNPGAENIFRLYAGYVSLLPNAIAWASVNLLPLIAAPFAFAAASTMLAATSFFLISRPAHSWLIASPAVRALFSLALAILPLSKEFLVTNVAYSQWTILLVLVVLVTRRPLPTSNGGLAAWVVAVALCAASNPLSIMCLPLAVIHLFLAGSRRQKICVLALSGFLIAYQIFCVDHGSVRPVIEFQSITLALKTFLARVVCEVFIGPRITNLLVLSGESKFLYMGGSALLLLLLSMTASSAKPARNSLIVLSAVVFALSLVTIAVMTRYTTPETSGIYLNLVVLQRYFYVPKVTILSMFMWQIMPRLEQAVAGPPRRALKTSLVISAIGLFLVALAQGNSFLYGGNAPEGLRVKQLVEDVQTNLAKAKLGQPYSSTHVLPRDWGGGVTLDIDQRRRNLK